MSFIVPAMLRVPVRVESDGSPPRRRSTNRRSEILDATLDTLVDVGDSGTFIQEVCSRSGVSVGTLYHHFGSKDLLIATLHYTVLNEYQSGAGALLSASPPPGAEEGIKSTVEYHVRWLIGHPKEAAFLLNYPYAGLRSSSVPAELIEQNRVFMRLVRRWLGHQMDDGAIERLPFDTVVALLIGPIHHWARAELYRGRDHAARHLGETSAVLAEGVWRSLRPAEARSPGQSGGRSRS
jgi:AcrR family transcriptional regulator